MLVRGDFNGRIGERGARNWEEEKGDGKKNKRQGGKCRGEEADGVERRKWTGTNKGTKKGT
jgi:hypothetical protein